MTFIGGSAEPRRRSARIVLAALALGAAAAPGAAAQVRVNPTGVSVSAMRATTVYLTYGGLRDQRAGEGVWCGELVSAAPAVGLRCDPTTIFGRLPARYDLSRTAPNRFTDIMSIPASVARLAYDAARQGRTSTFFYVRRFVSATGAPDEYVAVTCRLTGGGARAPFSLTDVHLTFGGRDVLPFIAPGTSPPPISARITYTGTGRLVGRWEVVLAGEDPPEPRDLFTEASLPPEERGTQRHFTELERFNLFLPPGGPVTLPGPDLRRLPTTAAGTYHVLLRIEATNDREQDSNLGDAGAGSGIVHSGAVAGFPMPVLRYVVAGRGARTVDAEATELRLIAPPADDSSSVAAPLVVAWMPAAAAPADFYHLEFETEHGRPLFGALLPGTARRYETPRWVTDRAAGQRIRCRVIALTADGRHIAASGWRSIRLAITLPDNGSPSAPPTIRPPPPSPGTTSP